MTSAAVGFQCPDCIKAGRKETRSGLAAYGGKRSTNPMLTTYVLIAINALVWLAIRATGSYGWVERLLALLPQDSLWSKTLVVDGVSGGAWWQVLTSAFTHVELWHVGMNMLALYMLGPAVENVMGRWHFLTVYLTAALTGSAVVMWLGDPNVQTVGASGAIYGLLGALLVIALRHKGETRQLWTLILINVAITAAGYSFISWQAHLGGFIGGAAATAIIALAPRANRARWQWAGVAGLLVLLVVSIGVRALMLQVVGGPLIG